MTYQTDDLRIKNIKELRSPQELHAELPITDDAAATVYKARQSIHHILHDQDDRLLVVVGPCSVHDPDAALEYATRLKPLADELKGELCMVMRVYFEKPRTTVGWKG
jgi:3-deoxy-7-phosphoheptulonate synthase